MPARIVIAVTGAETAELFGLSEATELKPRYNAAPPQDIPVIRVVNGTRELAHLLWGLIPHWSRKPPDEPYVNARSETVAEKPSFRDAFRSRRCLVPANGFYGWKPGPKPKQPYFFRPKGGGVFACAAIWDRWTGVDDDLETVSVLTMPANELVMPCDDRMPVILDREQFAAWLDPKEKEPAKLLATFKTYPAEQMECWPVSTRVNSPTEDDPELLAPLFPNRCETGPHMIHVVATITLNAGTRPAYLDVFRGLTPIVRTEAGCIEYQATVDVPTTIAVQDGPRPDVVTVIEKWENVEALYAHSAMPHMTEYRTKVKDFVAGVKLVVSESI